MNTARIADLPPRIAAKIRPTESGCWQWTASVRSSGYGAAYLNGKATTAHRVTYELIVGPIADGLTIDHLCRNKLCCNPAHLEAVTQAENNRRAPEWAKRLTVCRKGLHEMTAENAVVRADGSRRCSACRNAYSAEYRKQWLAANKDKTRAYSRAYKARKKAQA